MKATSSTVQRAEDDLAAAEAVIYRERARAALLALDRLAYGPLDLDQTEYLVTHRRRELGTLRPERPDNPGAPVCDWYAHPVDAAPGVEVGPYRLARQAAAALLNRVRE